MRNKEWSRWTPLAFFGREKARSAMKAFILTILILGVCGAVGADMELTTEENRQQWEKDTCIRDDPRMYIDLPIDTIRICCCTVFVPCTVYVRPDSLFKARKARWDAFEAWVNSVLREIR